MLGWIGFDVAGPNIVEVEGPVGAGGAGKRKLVANKSSLLLP